MRIGNHTSEYLKVARSRLGTAVEIPIDADGGVLSSRYASLTDSEIADLMACYTGIAQCEEKLDMMEGVRPKYQNVPFYSNVLGMRSGTPLERRNAHLVLERSL